MCEIDDSHAQISYQANGPYQVTAVPEILDATGKNIVKDNTTILCRCGLSRKMPHCDSSHLKKEFQAPRGKSHLPDRRINYRGKNILIHFNPAFCSHDGTCLRTLPKVFSQSHNPWIQPDEASADRIIEVINSCPSGALSYTLNGIRFSEVSRKPSIRTVKYGPLNVVGKVKLLDIALGELQPESLEHYSLCRCGLSGNIPYCDGSHFASDMDE